MDKRLLRRVTEDVAVVCPIVGMGMPSEDKATWRIDFDPAASSGERDAANAVVAGIDVAALIAELEAEEADESARQLWLKTVRERYQALQDDLDQARTAFVNLKARYDKLEAWAETKGYVP